MPRKSAAELAVIPLDPKATRLRPPSTLSESERSIFIDTVSTNKPEHFQPSDMPLLIRWCEATALGDIAAQHLRDEGAVVGGRPSPWVTVQEKSVRAMVSLSMRLRLSTQARQPNNPTRSPTVSVYERMRLDHDQE